MAFNALLDHWQDTPVITKTDGRYHIRLTLDDAARIEALAELFPGLDAETVIADLLQKALDEIEAAMPYTPGETVIRKDEFGDPIFEDTGLTPRYVELVRRHREALD